jgi:hypothetical protein
MINIPNPCPRKSSSMAKVSTGFYCDDCCKVVVDFRGKPNEEILASIRKQQGETCGIFTPSQVKTSRSFSFGLVRFAAALLLVFGVTLFPSCGDEPEVAGAICIDDSARFVDSMNANAEFQKMKADSIWVADSVAKAGTVK